MAPMAEGFESHNKTSFPYDHSCISNCLFCLFCVLLTFSGLSCHFLALAAGFLGTFYQVSPFRNLSEVPLDPQTISGAGIEPSGMGTSSRSSFDFT